jgi:hypothetical protein
LQPPFPLRISLSKALQQPHEPTVASIVGAQHAAPVFGTVSGNDESPCYTRLGPATVIVWHNADHYGQMLLYLRLNGIVQPASRPIPPKPSEQYLILPVADSALDIS